MDIWTSLLSKISLITVVHNLLIDYSPTVLGTGPIYVIIIIITIILIILIKNLLAQHLQVTKTMLASGDLEREEDLRHVVRIGGAGSHCLGHIYKQRLVK